jgi:hypothetical protein
MCTSLEGSRCRRWKSKPRTTQPKAASKASRAWASASRDSTTDVAWTAAGVSVFRVVSRCCNCHGARVDRVVAELEHYLRAITQTAVTTPIRAAAAGDSVDRFAACSLRSRCRR